MRTLIKYPFVQQETYFLIRFTSKPPKVTLQGYIEALKCSYLIREFSLYPGGGYFINNLWCIIRVIYLLLNWSAEAKLCSQVGFRAEEGQAAHGPSPSAAVRFSSLDGVDCDCALRTTRAGPVLLVQGMYQGI